MSTTRLCIDFRTPQDALDFADYLIANTTGPGWDAYQVTPGDSLGLADTYIMRSKEQSLRIGALRRHVEGYSEVNDG